MAERSILVVDDELLIRDLLYDFFKDQGWEISIADNGKKALELLKSKEFDLLLTDIKMPEMDGLDLASKVKMSHPDLPIMLMTGYPSVESAVSGLRNKVEDYIIKPFNINQLFKSIEQIVSEGSDSD